MKNLYKNTKRFFTAFHPVQNDNAPNHSTQFKPVYCISSSNFHKFPAEESI